jgi:hypothetical protein
LGDGQRGEGAGQARHAGADTGGGAFDEPVGVEDQGATGGRCRRVAWYWCVSKMTMQNGDCISPIGVSAPEVTGSRSSQITN